MNNAYKIFEVDTDAIAVNRGFYYQYLVSLNKWISNYISNKESQIMIEVDDDIKEVGNELVFTQVKCYTSSFSFQSDEIKKSVFNFFMLFLKYKGNVPIKFHFLTNTNLAKKEKLLKAWKEDTNLQDEEIRKQCTKEIKDILYKELEDKKKRKIDNNKNISKKVEIETAHNDLINEINSEGFNEFISSIYWDFGHKNPEQEIENISKEIRETLKHEKFQSKPIHLVESVLLSEIYKCSQKSDKNERVVTNSTLDYLLKETDKDLQNYVDIKFLSRINFNYEQLREQFKETTETVINHEGRLIKLENERKEKLYPKELTIIPNVPTTAIYGRENSFSEVSKLLEEKRILSFYGSIGIGKTFFVQKCFLDSPYDHFIWIDAKPSLINAIILDSVLLDNLQLDVSKYKTVEEQFKIVCNEIGKISGNNLLIIDNFENELDNLCTLISVKNWKIIITTNLLLTDVYQYKLPDLDINHAIKIYYEHTKQLKTNEAILIEFIKYINFNPLIIEICAKTIFNSLDLNIENLFSHIKLQTLDDTEINIEINMGKNIPNTILPYLLKRFELNNLTGEEQYILQFLALLSSENINIDDLAQIGGKESYKENKIFFTNTINSLNDKGWVVRTGTTIKMYRIVQEIIKYNEKGENNFFSCISLIVWLFKRIDENALKNPKKSFKFLKYAESILDSIKEKDRISMYQPLLLLECALLNAYDASNQSIETHDRWLDLCKRAENYLHKDDCNLGTILNNVSTSYARKQDQEKDLIYLNKAIVILEKNLPQSACVLFVSYTNLLHISYANKDINRAIEITKSAINLVKNNILPEQSIANFYYTIANGYKNWGDFDKAVIYYKAAIDLHLNIKEDERNDFFLALYYYGLTSCFFFLKEYRDAVMCLLESKKILETMNLTDIQLFTNICETLTLFYNHLQKNEIE